MHFIHTELSPLLGIALHLTLKSRKYTYNAFEKKYAKTSKVDR